MQSLVEACKNKYEDPGLPDDDDMNGIVILIPKSRPGANAGGLSLPPRLTMDAQQINTCGEVDKDLVQPFKNVRELDLTKNCITDWSQIFKVLEVMPNLEFLNLTMNPLNGETWVTSPAPYPQMKSLILNDTRVSWTIITKLLQLFPSPPQVFWINKAWEQRLDNPEVMKLSIVFSSPEHEVLKELGDKARRQQLVARLPNLTDLNRTRILELELEDAERAFVRQYQDSKNPPDRLKELEKKYGKLDPLVNLDLAPVRFKNLVKFGDKVEWMEINRNQTVAAFRKLLKNFTGLPIKDTYVLHFDMVDGELFHYSELRIGYRLLLTHNIKEGDEIHIFPSDCDLPASLSAHRN